MARLGSKEKPAVIRVKTSERAEEIAEICNEHGWQFIVGIEPDKTEDISDVEKLLALQSAFVRKQKTGRNEPCPCGSGMKYKKCCLNKKLDAPSMQDAVDWITDNTILVEEFAKIIKKYEAEPLDEITASLFLDAFIFDHRLVSGKTPFEVFLKNANIHPSQKDVFESYKNNIYSLFEVLEIDLGKGLELFDIISKKNYYIKERRGTYAAERGSIIIGRIAKTDGSFVAISPAFNSFPKDAAFLLKKIFESKPTLRLSAFDIFGTLLKKMDPPKSHDELIDELQELTEKCGIDIDITSINKRINSSESPDEAFPEIYHANIVEDKKRELIDLLYEIWNKYPRKEFNGKSPQDIDKKGPKEKMLIQALMMEIIRKINPDNYKSIESALEAANRIKDKWINMPQKDLEGKTPLDAILEERKTLKNPDKDFNLNITLSQI